MDIFDYLFYCAEHWYWWYGSVCTCPGLWQIVEKQSSREQGREEPLEMFRVTQYRV